MRKGYAELLGRATIRHRRKSALTFSDPETCRLIFQGYRDTSRSIAAWCQKREEVRRFRTRRNSGADMHWRRIPGRMNRPWAASHRARDAERKH